MLWINCITLLARDFIDPDQATLGPAREVFADVNANLLAS